MFLSGMWKTILSGVLVGMYRDLFGSIDYKINNLVLLKEIIV